jgi:murein DD-endopeptidase MepM/ murein hydrolase activator NlpD
MKPISIFAGLAVAAFASAAQAACPDLTSGARPVLARPVPGGVVSHFGPRVNPGRNYVSMHTGVDYAAAAGDPVHAAAAGVVIVARQEPGGYGKHIRVRHAAGYVTTYAQLSQILVRKGNCVAAGAVIARTGTTELGDHLHFEVVANGRFVNPLDVVGAAQ